MTANHFTLRGWHVLAGMLAFFGLVIAVNVLFMIAAVGSFPGEDVRRSYLQGLHYNETLEERREQVALGWRASAQLASRSDGVALVVDLGTRDGAPLSDLTIEGVLRWPTDARRDRSLAFVADGAGRYHAQLGALEPGHWRLRARAHDAEGRARDFETELSWPPL